MRRRLSSSVDDGKQRKVGERASASLCSVEVTSVFLRAIILHSILPVLLTFLCLFPSPTSVGKDDGSIVRLSGHCLEEYLVK